MTHNFHWRLAGRYLLAEALTGCLLLALLLAPALVHAHTEVVYDFNNLTGSDTAPVVCEPGFFSDTGFEPCTPAPAGHFVATSEATFATACAIGTFQPDEGQTFCLAAPAGYFVDVQGAESATPCALGSYSNVTGAAACTLAEIGFYVDFVGASAPLECPDEKTTLNPGATALSFCVEPGTNQPPLITAVSVPADPVPVDTQVEITAEFIDPDEGDTHTCSIDFGDGSDAVDGDVSDLTCTGEYSYDTAGVYTVTVTVTDAAGESDTKAAADFVVVYDPAAGFVTGAGWITSPDGAYTVELELSGRARFGFVSRYKRGASIPDGNTQFRFDAAGFTFNSTAYDWLVIAGSNAKFKGIGTINDEGDFGFMLTATDGDPDLFRIKIWDRSDGDAIVYDNQMGEGDDGYAGTAIGGGQIKIHTAGGRPGKSDATVAIDGRLDMPEAFELSSAYPNPFNPHTTIGFALPEASVVHLAVYDVLGRMVAVLADGSFEAGRYTITFDAAHLPSGTYLYRLEAGSFTRTQRMVLVK